MFGIVARLKRPKVKVLDHAFRFLLLAHLNVLGIHQTRSILALFRRLHLLMLPQLVQVHVQIARPAARTFMTLTKVSLRLDEAQRMRRESGMGKGREGGAEILVLSGRCPVLGNPFVGQQWDLCSPNNGKANE